MKRKFIIFFLILFMGVGVIFTGCNTTDLSGINAEIDSLKQQITSLNQTITDLQTRLNDAEGDVSSLQSQLAISIANYNELYTRVYGESNAYLELTETFCYSTNGLKLFDLSIDSARFNTNSTAHSVTYTFKSYVSGVDNLEDVRLPLNFLLYDYSSNQTYEKDTIYADTNRIVFTLNIPDEVRTGLLYVYVGNTIGCIYNISFDEIES